MGPAYRAELQFALQDRGTRLVNTLTYTFLAHRDMAAANGMTEGMEMSFQSLDRLLAEEQG